MDRLPTVPTSGGKNLENLKGGTIVTVSHWFEKLSEETDFTADLYSHSSYSQVLRPFVEWASVSSSEDLLRLRNQAHRFHVN